MLTKLPRLTELPLDDFNWILLLCVFSNFGLFMLIISSWLIIYPLLISCIPPHAYGPSAIPPQHTQSLAPIHPWIKWEGRCMNTPDFQMWPCLLIWPRIQPSLMLLALLRFPGAAFSHPRQSAKNILFLVDPEKLCTPTNPSSLGVESLL